MEANHHTKNTMQENAKDDDKYEIQQSLQSNTLQFPGTDLDRIESIEGSPVDSAPSQEDRPSDELNSSEVEKEESNQLESRSPETTNISQKCSRSSLTRDEEKMIRRKSSSTLQPAGLLSTSSSDSEMNVDVIAIKAKSAILEYCTDDEDDYISEEDEKNESEPRDEEEFIKQELSGFIMKEIPAEHPRLSVSEEHGQPELNEAGNILQSSNKEPTGSVSDPVTGLQNSGGKSRLYRSHTFSAGSNKKCVNVEEALRRLKARNRLGNASSLDRRSLRLWSISNYSSKINEPKTTDVFKKTIVVPTSKTVNVKVENNSELEILGRKILQRDQEIGAMLEKILKLDQIDTPPLTGTAKLRKPSHSEDLIRSVSRNSEKVTNGGSEIENQSRRISRTQRNSVELRGTQRNSKMEKKNNRNGGSLSRFFSGLRRRLSKPRSSRKAKNS